MIHSTDKKRVLLFIIFAFLIAWGTALAIFLTGGLIDSPILIPSMGISLAYILMATIYMFAPALAHILTRLITREGWQGLWLKPRSKGNGRYIAAAWFLPGLLTILGAAAYYLIFRSKFDFNLTNLTHQLTTSLQAYESAPTMPIGPWVIILLQAIQAIILSPLLNGISTFGEEFGWRAYLLPKLLPIGVKKSVLLIGVIWGIWHWPLILMGYNYGFNYPGAPWLGLIAMVWVTIGLSIIFSWLTLRSGSVWAAVIAHAGVNGIAALGNLALIEASNPLLGPTPLGFVGGIFFAILGINLLLHPTALTPTDIG